MDLHHFLAIHIKSYLFNLQYIITIWSQNNNRQRFQHTKQQIVALPVKTVVAQTMKELSLTQKQMRARITIQEFQISKERGPLYVVPSRSFRGVHNRERVKRTNHLLAERTKCFLKSWEILGSDNFILEIVQGFKIALLVKPRQQKLS